MSTSPDLSSFGKFIPGFDFLQNLSKQNNSAAPEAQSLMPNLGSWIAPTLNEEELSKRIDELKAVSYWLEQNATALKATIQALEVQKMTLATLKRMNFSFDSGVNKSGNDATDVKEPTHSKDEASRADGKVDALQWWNALTQQFGAIASKTLQDAAAKAAADSPGKASVSAKSPSATVKSKPKTRKTKPVTTSRQ